MIDFSDEPYRYFPPRYSRPWARLLLWHNRRQHLPNVHRIDGVEVSGHEQLAEAIRPGDRLLFLPNHSTHSDAAIFLEALSQIGQRCLMMAAYDVFLRGKIHRFALQRMGAFSVDRDANDSRPMKQALATLERGKFGLIVFPEGNVYLTNDRVTPFMDGAAFIGLRAQAALQDKTPPTGSVLAVPVSIKATHVTNARERIAQRFTPLAKQLDVETDFRDQPVAAVHATGVAALRRNLKQRGLDVPDTDSLTVLALRAASDVLDRLEAKLEITPKPGDTPLDRVRAARRVVHEVRTDPDRAVDHAAAATWADEAMLAFRIASYPLEYVAEKPTLDRVGETVEKLEEDLLTRLPPPFAERHAYVRFNEPIDLGPYLEGGTKLRLAVRKLTADAERSVQSGLDRLNHDNPHPGGRDW
ncbi:MAG: lysophospholipid acyltransferase family protein [Planctomycetota bacterium]